VRAAVEEANASFIAARAKADSTLLRRIATGAWLVYEQSYIAELQRRAQTERWRNTAFDVHRIVIEDETAVVCTVERWEVAVVLAHGQPTSEQTQVWHERYILVHHDGAWLVSDILFGEESCAA